jgi:hypothetical protein
LIDCRRHRYTGTTFSGPGTDVLGRWPIVTNRGTAARSLVDPSPSKDRTELISGLGVRLSRPVAG